MGSEEQLKTSLFLVPRSSTAWRGNEGVWIAVAGWAAAGEQLFGHALVATSDGIFTPAEARALPRVGGTTRSSWFKPIRQVVPEVFITAWKDVILRNSRPDVWPVDRFIASAEHPISFIWERHDLFSGPGRRLADQLKVPLVTSVDGPVVWEAEKWGVKRPVWGRWLESRSEATSLKRSDLVACVSDQVREKVLRMGVEDKKVMVVDNRVDASLFHPAVSGEKIRAKFGLSEKIVIGWTGSFKSFHGLDTVLEGFSRILSDVPNAVLMLVGDGPEYEAIKALAHYKNIVNSVVMPGRQSFENIPDFVAAFDIALVSAPAGGGFHYSPLKLREYLALGKPVLAPKAGDIPHLFRDGVDMMLFDPADTNDFAKKLSRIARNSALREQLSSRALELFRADGSWKNQLMAICDRVGIAYHRP